jgi:hypothetical protein
MLLRVLLLLLLLMMVMLLLEHVLSKLGDTGSSSGCSRWMMVAPVIWHRVGVISTRHMLTVIMHPCNTRIVHGWVRARIGSGDALELVGVETSRGPTAVGLSQVGMLSSGRHKLMLSVGIFSTRSPTTTSSTTTTTAKPRPSWGRMTTTTRTRSSSGSN